MTVSGLYHFLFYFNIRPEPGAVCCVRKVKIRNIFLPVYPFTRLPVYPFTRQLPSVFMTCIHVCLLQTVFDR